MKSPPESTRSISLGEREVAYRLVRVRRRTVGLQVGHDGLTVRAPLRLTLGELQQVLHEKSGWILSKLAEWSRRSEHAPMTAWHDGGLVLYEGVPHTLALQAGPRVRVNREGSLLRVHLPLPSDPAAVARSIEQWMRKRAAEAFAPRLGAYAAALGVPVPRLMVYGPRTLWGSCNRSGLIRLHWRLVQLPPALADYIIAHEVAHLQEMNHGSQFWAVVARLYPDFRAARAAVRQFEPLLR